MSDLEIPICRLPGNEDLPLPSYQSAGAAGMDLHAAVTGDLTIPPGRFVVIPCGYAMAVPVGYEAQIRPRSGLAAKYGISIPNTPGTVDSDYRGEIKVILINHGQEPFVVTRGARIAQMVVLPVLRVVWKEIPEIPPTARGDGGFGHTGV